ncbi:MAG: putative ABC transporter permease [Lachnospiraceae bacterium]|nr:putative ABC transporter permease [Lachnospiraceae bacterium]
MEITYDFCELNIMIALVSFLGFLTENCWLAITRGYVNNRNMNLPFLFGYGLAMMFFYVFIGTPDNLRMTELFHVHMGRRNSYIFYFFVSAILVSVGEVLLGTFVERYFGFEYWNYTGIPLCITKYTSVPTSTGFGVAITLWMGCAFENIMERIHNMSEVAVKIMGFVFPIVIIVDFIVSFRIMYHNQSPNTKWVKKVIF